MIGLILTMGMVMGCDNGSNDTKPKVTAPSNNDPTDGRVIAVQYRGTYQELPPNNGIITLNEKTMISLGKEIPAWTVGNILWITNFGGSDTIKLGEFGTNSFIFYSSVGEPDTMTKQ